MKTFNFVLITFSIQACDNQLQVAILCYCWQTFQLLQRNNET